MLRRSPSFAVLSVLIFTICLAVNSAVFSIANALLLQPMPGFRELDRLVAIWTTREDSDHYPFTFREFFDYRNATQALENVAAVARCTGSLKTEYGAETLVGLRVSGNFFEMAGVAAELGRAFGPEDETSGQPRVVLITHNLWTRVFRSRPEVIGSSIMLNGRDQTVLGVLPRGFVFPENNPDFVLPLAGEFEPSRDSRFSTHLLRLYGRLRTGRTTRQAETDLNAVAARLREQYPEAYAHKTGMRVVPLRQQILGPLRARILLAFTAVFLMSLVAASNLAGVFVVRALDYQNDLTVLTALGTGPVTLFWHVLLQSMAVCLSAGVLGTAVALLCLPHLSWALPGNVLSLDQVHPDRAVWLASLSLSLVCAAVFGLPAAIRAAKLPGSGLFGGAALRSLASTSGGPRKFLVIGEVAFCLVVVTGTGLLLRSLLRLEAVNPGFRASNVLTFGLVLPPSKFPTREDVTRAHDQLAAAIQSIPGVTAGTISNLPLRDSMGEVDLDFLDERGRPQRILDAPYLVADDSYFRVMQIPILEGRAFLPSDNGSAPPVAVISKTLARRLGAPKTLIGAKLRIDDNAGQSRDVFVAGVAADVSGRDLEGPPEGAIYVPLPQVPQAFARYFANNMSWVLRTPGPPTHFADIIRDRVVSAASEAGVSKMRSMDALVEVALTQRRSHLRLITVFAVALLSLAAIGLYALIAHSVHQRTREIGVRIALGARSREIVFNVIGEGLALTCAGIGIGLGAMFVLARLLSTMLFEVPVYDPVTLAAAVLLMIFVAVLATCVPALRATRLDPVLALRQK